MIARILAVAFALAFTAGVALARPGGGHSFHSSSSHSSSSSSHSYSSHSYSSPSSSHPYSSGGGGGSYYSGGGGGGDGGALLVVFVILLGIVVLAVVLKLVFDNLNTSSADTWAATYQPEQSYAPPPPHLELGTITAADPDFSLAVFEDFAYQLYAAAHLARADGRLPGLAPYLGAGAIAWLQSRTAPPPTAVVVGALQTETARRVVGDQLQLTVRFESNLISPDTTRYSIEHWTFVRDAAARTKAPVRTRTWPCPNCGAPWQAAGADGTVCAYCGAATAHGKFDWTVEAIRQDALDTVGPTLRGTVDEEGTDKSTIVDPAGLDTWNQLHADDPAVTWAAFKQRVTLVYARLNEGWNAQDLAPVRGLVSSSMQDYLRYWIDEYKRQQLHNHLDDANLSEIDLAKVRRDTYYDAVTVRVYASGLDYTLDDKGTTVGGSRKSARTYSEYWTFIRASTRRGPIVTTPACPNCGAPLDVIADSGACAHCSAVIDNGSFDFVLSKIEQDEVYEG